MKKCILMFALWITALLLAVFTEVKKNSEIEPSYAASHQLVADELLVEYRSNNEKHQDIDATE